MTQREDHVAAGWNDEFRWIEVGQLRLEEDDKGAMVRARIALPSCPPDGAPVELYGPTWLSATELMGLTRNLTGWFTDDPVEALQQIEKMAKHVKTELDAWDDRARIDEEHPPYAKLVNVLDGLIKTCRELREKGPFTEAST